MSAVLADTHATLWYLSDPSRLSADASAALTAAESGGDFIYFSAISLVEVMYLVEKHRLPPTAWGNLLAVVDDPTRLLRVLPVDVAVARALERIPRDIVPDMPDRIIAATALAHGLPLVTADARIRAAPVPTIW